MTTSARVRPPLLYGLLFRTVIRHMDPERAHHLVIAALKAAQRLPGGLSILRAIAGGAGTERIPGISRIVLGQEQRIPFGLAAGFDKDGQVIPALLALGFGHVEVGTVTPRPQPGNPRPRCFRLVDDHALINRMGFNNAGAAALAKRLARVRWTEKGQRAVIGVNIGKNKTTAPEDAVEDYRSCARRLAPYASYLAINVSSPNTPGLRDLQSVDMLRPILAAVVDEAQKAARMLGRAVPVLVKIAPDLHDDDILAVARLAEEEKLAGVIAHNTTIARPETLRSDRGAIEKIGAGGLSGPILADRSREILSLLREALPENMTIISCGGVTTAADVRERLEAGADLVQGYTALIYQGPQWPGRIARGLAGR